jgi:hypothetical protein
MSLPANRRPRSFQRDVSGAGREHFWEEAHQAFFPKCYGSQTTDDGTKNEWQAAGVDRVVHVEGGRTYFVEEKERDAEWGDFLLEVYSDEERQSPGWINKELACDYVAYAFRSTGKVYYLPWLLLKRAWTLNSEKWLDKARFGEDGFGLHRSSTGTSPGGAYTTLNVSVPIETLFVALCHAAVVTGTRI